jgi:cold shock CspA family protein
MSSNPVSSTGESVFDPSRSTRADPNTQGAAAIRDVFVHRSALERSGLTDLGEGQRVVAEIVEGRKGLEAARVRLV